jgi:hypothetical protein
MECNKVVYRILKLVFCAVNCTVEQGKPNSQATVIVKINKAHK